MGDSEGLGMGEQETGQGLGQPGVLHGIEEVHVNTNLLRPIQLQVDPAFQRVRSDEKEQMKALNNKFASFIEKVQCLERQNQALLAKWELLQQQSSGPEESRNINNFFHSYVTNLQRQLETLQSQKEQLGPEAYNMFQLVEDYKKRFEDEINKRTSKEEEFVELKKELDSAYMGKMAFDVRVDILRQELEFLRCLYEAELSQLQTVVGNTDVILSMDNHRDLNMDGIIEEVRQEYEGLAHRSTAEVDAMYRGRYQDLQNMWVNQQEQLRNSHQEVQELARQIQRLQPEIEIARKRDSIKDAEHRGSSAIRDGQEKLQELENTLQQAKEDLSKLVHDYQELLNVKLGLDIEIAMYRSLLEEEENRIQEGSSATISLVVVGQVMEEEKDQDMEAEEALAVEGPSVEEEEAQVEEAPYPRAAAALAVEDPALVVVGQVMEEEKDQDMEEEEALAVEGPSVEGEEAQVEEAPYQRVAAALAVEDPALVVVGQVMEEEKDQDMEEEEALAVEGPSVEEEDAQVEEAPYPRAAAALEVEDPALVVVGQVMEVERVQDMEEEEALALEGRSVEEEEAQVEEAPYPRAAAALAVEDPALVVVGQVMEVERVQDMEEEEALALEGRSVEEEEAQVEEAPCPRAAAALVVEGRSVEEEEAQVEEAP
ncbi:keratin, type II cytoskeletal 8-like [Cinclus cinclus]|uniref:keratin, type II cytoskeletal 8-like n=1 Tax=Cinclus cinclus TaxID=127875 RepID=UPI002E0E8499